MDERIAVLETKVEQMEEAYVSMNAKLDTLIANMNKSKGFWAGAVAAGTALGAVLGFLLQYIFNIKIG